MMFGRRRETPSPAPAPITALDWTKAQTDGLWIRVLSWSQKIELSSRSTENPEGLSTNKGEVLSFQGEARQTGTEVGKVVGEVQLLTSGELDVIADDWTAEPDWSTVVGHARVFKPAGAMGHTPWIGMTLLCGTAIAEKVLSTFQAAAAAAKEYGFTVRLQHPDGIPPERWESEKHRLVITNCRFFVEYGRAEWR